MIGTYLRSWLRWWCNPPPLPGQIWMLDSVGPVRVVDQGPLHVTYMMQPSEEAIAAAVPVATAVAPQAAFRLSADLVQVDDEQR